MGKVTGLACIRTYSTRATASRAVSKDSSTVPCAGDIVHIISAAPQSLEAGQYLWFVEKKTKARGFHHKLWVTSWGAAGS
jgi:hypothetical protein